jgi:hypothetical protein
MLGAVKPSSETSGCDSRPGYVTQLPISRLSLACRQRFLPQFPASPLVEGCGKGLQACRWRASRRCGAGLSLLAAVLCNVLLRSLNICWFEIGKDGIWAKAAHEESICSIFKPFSKDRGDPVSTKGQIHC